MSYTLNRTVAVLSQVLRERQLDVTMQKRQESVERTLAISEPPSTKAAEADFDRLSAESKGPGEYGYDAISTWRRGLERAQQLAREVPDFSGVKRALEVACGDGMCLVTLQTLGLQVQGVDLTDWRDVRARDVPFVTVNLDEADSTLPSASDLVFSYNAFEHFGDPAQALHAMVEAARPGGYLFFEFGPLYAGPWGLHAYRMLPMPYPQFLFSEPFWREKLLISGVHDLGQSLTDLQPLNRWTACQFDDLWSKSACEVLFNQRFPAQDCLDIVLRYPESFQGRGLTYEDLTTQSLRVLLRKPGKRLPIAL